MISLPSPAKINWFLHLHEQRADGYHNLTTHFQFIDLADEMVFVAKTSPVIEVSGLDIPLEDNLIYKAAKALQKYAPNQGVEIQITKKIPMGGGLGGGSSNAATTLLALNHLWGLHLSMEILLAEGVKLGADVPIFVLGQAAFGQGIGEVLTPHAVEETWLLLIQPACHVSTQKLFTHPELTRGLPHCKIEDLNFENSLSLIKPRFKNIFEPLVRKLYTSVADAMEWLNKHSHARLSGTGCCVFAPFESEEAARNIAEKMPKDMKGWVVKTLNKSPTHVALSRLS